MNSRPEIFLVATVLLVPFLYYTSSISDACAAISAPGFRSSQNCNEKVMKEGSEKTCCWREPIEGSILGQKYCQTCTEKCSPDQKSCTETCTFPEKKASATDPSGTLPDLNQDLTTERLPGGGVFKVPETNLTFSETDISSSNTSNNTLALAKPKQGEDEDDDDFLQKNRN